ncbi:MAG TPA: low-specificity L-threonine aldolase [Myxococcales bacterium]|nr:low-specificity L-threonine aldolase [Myxococcales bacterium]
MVDLRSDTVTQPTSGMRDAMMSAPLGDDVFGDDPTVIQLQKTAAALLGKEAGLFVPSGTMSNQLALKAQCRAGDEIIIHEGAHIYNYESGAAAALAGVQVRTVRSADGSLPLDQVLAGIHQTPDPHYAPTGLICFENTHNACGGMVVPEGNVTEITRLAAERGIPTHLDGARLFNAVAASGRSAAQLAEPFETISICLSKGLGAPVGSVLVGSLQAIGRAYRFRKMYGGGMRQAGVLAGAGLYALANNQQRLADDHRRAKALAQVIGECPGLQVSLEEVHTNLVYINLELDHPLSVVEGNGNSALVNRLNDFDVLITGGPHRMRAALHLDVDDGGLDQAMAAFRQVTRVAG